MSSIAYKKWQTMQACGDREGERKKGIVRNAVICVVGPGEREGEILQGLLIIRILSFTLYEMGSI